MLYIANALYLIARAVGAPEEDLQPLGLAFVGEIMDAALDEAKANEQAMLDLAKNSPAY